MSDSPPIFVPAADDRTQLGREALETPARVRAHEADNAAIYRDLGRRLRAKPPRFVVTCARGSSDHAAVYGKYLIEKYVGRPVASVGLSIASVYGRTLDLTDGLFIAISQSGRSPDLLRLNEMAKSAGALVVGFVNDEASPLFEMSDVPVPLRAGEELSVAATKSYLLSCYAFLRLVAAWSGEAELLAAAESLPDALDAAIGLSWQPALAELVGSNDMFVLGRGLSFGAALEAALKLKETSRLHAEAFSTAEVIHGPFGLVGPNLPVLAFGQNDEAEPTIRSTIERVIEAGARAWSAVEASGAVLLQTVAGVAPTTQPLCQELSFYLAVQHLALARGLDPDNPPNLRKVTETR